MLYQNAFGPQFPVDFLTDVALGNLPQVSWLMGFDPNFGSPACSFAFWGEYFFANRRGSDRESGAVGEDGFACYLR